jgi:L-ascorbate metabolism protein UlaG (beta-lactamase superfamily)
MGARFLRHWAFGSILLAAALSCAAEEVSIRWLGQSCFLVTTPDGVRVLMDPVSPSTGYENPPQTVDVVTISHEHADHNHLALAQGAFSVLRALAPDGKDWNRARLEIGDARLYSVESYHDNEQGAARGLNGIFVIELPDFKLVHLGDLGHVLDEGQVAPLKGADVLLVPVGGTFTLDAAEAARVVEQVQPRSVVIPMHYRTPLSTNKQLAAADEFLKGKTVARPGGAEYKFETGGPAKPRSYVVLERK